MLPVKICSRNPRGISLRKWPNLSNFKQLDQLHKTKVIATLQLIQPFYSSLDFVRDNPVPEETFTHSHLSLSSIIHYQLPPSVRSTHPHGTIYMPDIFFHNLSPTVLTKLTAHISACNKMIHRFKPNKKTKLHGNWLTH